MEIFDLREVHKLHQRSKLGQQKILFSKSLIDQVDENNWIGRHFGSGDTCYYSEGSHNLMEGCFPSISNQL